MNTSRRITIKKIAEATGVSARVVAAVLAGDDAGTIGYSNATRGKVLKVAQRLGYLRNRTARWLRHGRHGSIGVVAETEYVIPTELLDGMLHAARQRGVFLVQDRTPRGESPMFLQEDCVDGLVCFSDMDAASLARMRRMNLPVVWVNTNRRRGANVVTYDERGAARHATAHLAACGWRYPAYITGVREHYSTPERIAGMRSVVRSAPVLFVQDAPWLRGAAFERMINAMQGFLHTHACVNAIITANALLLPALYEAVKRTGRRVGTDVGVLTFGWLDFSIAVDPNATVMALELYDVGSRIIEMIEKLIAGGRTGRLIAPYVLVERASTTRAAQ